MLSVENLHVSFGIRRGNKNITVNSVRGVSFQMQRGEILGIVGESGSGKTVTTTAIPGLHGENATVTGNIWYNNSSSESAESASFINLAELSQSELRQYRGKKIGMIFQEPGRSFDPLQNMESVFFEAFRNSDPEITKEEAFAKAARLMEEVGLPDPEKRLKNFPHQFSGGQLQRIGIALSLAQGCELLIADEPTTALDVTIQAQIVELLRELNKKRNLSIIFISHNINLVADLCQNIIVMYGGIVMDKLTSQEVRNYMDSAETEFTTHSPYTSALLASTPKFGTHYTAQKMISIPGRVTDPSHPEPGCPFAPRCSYAKEECKCNLTSEGALTCWKMNLNQEEENV
ncbi:MAG: ABC transporter ATP-binding protein [Treponema sp.]|nr:ABC transporter ATP-binding protein [Candidatus Treponema equifaecale]